jgi:hypothetical protein
MINKINELIDYYKQQYTDIVIQEQQLLNIIKNINTDKTLSSDKEYHKLILKSYNLIIENKEFCSKNIFYLIKNLDNLNDLINENIYLENKIKNL